MISCLGKGLLVSSSSEAEGSWLMAMFCFCPVRMSAAFFSFDSGPCVVLSKSVYSISSPILLV